MSPLEEIFAHQWDFYYPNIDLHHDYKFLKKRKFRFDFVHLKSKTALEIHGKIWRGGRHTTGAGLNSDSEKTRLCLLAGWVIFPLTSDQINSEKLEQYIHEFKQLIDIRSGEQCYLNL